MEESSRSNWIAIGVTLALTVVLIVGIVLISNRGKNGGTSDAAVTVSAQDWIKGPESAKVTIVAYEDFQCPACGSFQPVLDNLLEKYPTDVRLVYRHFPLTQIHQNAQKAAEASEAAGAQGKFWEMHNKIFSNQTSLSVDNLKIWAGELGLDTAKFNSELDNGTYFDQVDADRQSGLDANVDATPTLFINGKKYTGRLSSDGVNAEIVKILAGQS